MSKQQTAVDYITQGLEKLRHKFDQDTILTLQYLIIEAKQMEKEQIMDTGNCVAEVVLTDDESYNGNKYWNEFYGGDHE